MSQFFSACAGDGFSIFWTDLGVVLSCGDNSKGCLGLADSKNYNEPKVIGTATFFFYLFWNRISF